MCLWISDVSANIQRDVSLRSLAFIISVVGCLHADRHTLVSAIALQLRGMMSENFSKFRVWSR